ncbi:MAG: nucleotide sugar dehydrogenase [Candidatus Aenigmatarchaeota archaeon]
MLIFSIFGLGNIGLPLTCIFASIGKVIAADIDKEKINQINKGECPLKNEEFVPELLRKYVKEKKIEATVDLEHAAKNSDVKIIITPLIINKNKKLDFSNIVSVSEVIGKNLKKGDLVIVSTTMPIGGTRNVVGKILEKKSGLKAGEDFYLVYAPEQAMNPHVIKDLTENYEQIIGGVNQESAEKAKAIYEKINKKGVIIVRNCETAELIKLAGAGIYRYVNIALAAEIARICENFDIDFIEVMEKTNLIKYYHLHKPTIGVGGHCVPVYPYFIFNNFKDQKLLEASIKINENLPRYSINIIKKFFGSLKGKKIGIFGLSYRGDVREDRFSPTYEIIKILKREGVKVFINDPYYTKEELELKTGVKYINEDEMNKLDGIIIATDHERYKSLDFPKNLKFVFDGKSFLDPEKIKKKGIKYLAIGRLCF